MLSHLLIFHRDLMKRLGWRVEKHLLDAKCGAKIRQNPQINKYLSKKIDFLLLCQQKSVSLQIVIIKETL